MKVLAVLLALLGASSGGVDIGALTKQASALRGIPVRQPIGVRQVDRVQMRRIVLRLTAGETDERSSARWDRALHLLGVLESSQRLATIQHKLLTAQVAGLYDPQSKQLFVVVAQDQKPPKSVIVHEIVHALQDQAFNLQAGAFAPNARRGDGALAAQAVVEGDATEVQSRFLTTSSSADQLSELRVGLAQGAAGLKGVPGFLVRGLLFPYSDGERFVAALRARGGARLVDQAFRTPPRTTLAILDPSRFPDRDGSPVTFAKPKGRSALDEVFGAADVQALLDSASIATAWRGGRITLRPHDLVLQLAIEHSFVDLTVAKLRKLLPRSRTTVTVQGDRITAVMTGS